jgi:organic radical activating enzyme
MTDRVIHVLDTRASNLALERPRTVVPATGRIEDTRGRPLRDLRISVTDRCNFRCTYCMPKEVFDQDYRFLRHSDLLSFEEIARLTRLFIAHGVEKVRLTGGEPLLRKDLHKLIEMLAPMKTRDGRELDLALTTNASILARKARQLADAGLKRVTVSLDGLDDAVFRRMNDVDFPVQDVLDGIEAAAAAASARSRSTWSSSAASTTRKSCRWRATSGAADTSCASSSSWTWARPTAGAWTTSCPRRKSCTASRMRCRCARSIRTTWARWPGAGPTRTAAARSA